jgi:hypothetical protein
VHVILSLGQVNELVRTMASLFENTQVYRQHRGGSAAHPFEGSGDRRPFAVQSQASTTEEALAQHSRASSAGLVDRNSSAAEQQHEEYVDAKTVDESVKDAFTAGQRREDTLRELEDFLANMTVRPLIEASDRTAPGTAASAAVTEVGGEMHFL